jgi:predicted transposase YbfD/YdcC
MTPLAAFLPSWTVSSSILLSKAGWPDIAGSLKGETIAFDGKTLRGSFDSASPKSPLHSVWAWTCGLRLTLGLISISEKSNAIPAVQKLTNVLDLEGAVVTADAMHCQRETTKAVVETKVDYILVAKGNRPTLSDELGKDIVDAFDEDNSDIHCHHKSEIIGGREEYREISVLPCPTNSSVFGQWAGIQINWGHLSFSRDERSSGRIVRDIHYESALQSTRFKQTDTPTLGMREQPTLCFGCSFYRRYESNTEGNWS